MAFWTNVCCERTLVVVIGMLMLVGACSPLEQDENAQVEPTVTPIPTAPAAARPTFVVSRGTVQETLSFTGRWLPRDQIQLSFEIAGNVRAVNVQRDDTVQVGDLLADFQITDLEDNLASAELDLETAQSRLEDGSEGSVQSVVDAQFALADSNLSLENTRASAPWTSVESALINLESARNEIDNAQRAYDDLISRQDSSATAVDSAYQRIQSAQRNLQSAQNNYFSAAQNFNNHGFSVASAENNVIRNEINLERAQTGTGTDFELVQAVNSAQLRVDQIRSQIVQSSLFSSIDGVVLEVTIRPGDSVQAFTSVMTLAIPDPKEAIANLAFNDTQRLSVGMIGICQVLNQSETAVQCIVRQLPLSSRDVDQTVRVAASLDNVASGQLIDIEMPLQVREVVLWLPPQAIRTFQNRTFVVIQTPDGQQVVDVELGLQTDDRVEIVSGVNEGDVVVSP